VKPYQGVASLAGPASGLAALSTMNAEPMAATVTTGALLSLVPEASDEFGIPNLRVGVYTRDDHETTPFVV